MRETLVFRTRRSGNERMDKTLWRRELSVHTRRFRITVDVTRQRWSADQLSSTPGKSLIEIFVTPPVDIEAFETYLNSRNSKPAAPTQSNTPSPVSQTNFSSPVTSPLPLSPSHHFPIPIRRPIRRTLHTHHTGGTHTRTHHGSDGTTR